MQSNTQIVFKALSEGFAELAEIGEVPTGDQMATVFGKVLTKLTGDKTLHFIEGIVLSQAIVELAAVTVKVTVKEDVLK